MALSLNTRCAIPWARYVVHTMLHKKMSSTHCTERCWHRLHWVAQSVKHYAVPQLAWNQSRGVTASMLVRTWVAVERASRWTCRLPSVLHCCTRVASVLCHPTSREAASNRGHWGKGEREGGRRSRVALTAYDVAGQKV